MFDIGATELLLIVIVAVIVIGPKDLPLAMRTAGRWIGKVRRVSGHFRSGIESMIREAELEEMERKWREQNEAIMKEHPGAPETEAAAPSPASAEGALAEPQAQSGAQDARQDEGQPEPARDKAEPQLPLPPP
ncbi:MAG: twin-arginine translocase subunit TatB [Novosphingobium sp.]|nr:twin-arginine translocase subunit TatB [Planctomycetaceae bacterium]MCP5404525.1 twin-arginine translocase subunit TatB [Novosphingobium sp.]